MFNDNADRCTKNSSYSLSQLFSEFISTTVWHFTIKKKEEYRCFNYKETGDFSQSATYD